MTQGRTRGATARAALRRLGGVVPHKARTGANTGAQVADPGGLVDDPRASATVAAILEDLAGRIRRNGLAWFAERMADVDGQPERLTPMPTTQNPPTNGHALLTQQDLAAYLGCNVRTLRRWVHEGRIPEPCLSIGRVQRWRRGDVDRWLEGGR